MIINRCLYFGGKFLRIFFKSFADLYFHFACFKRFRKAAFSALFSNAVLRPFCIALYRAASSSASEWKPILRLFKNAFNTLSSFLFFGVTIRVILVKLIILYPKFLCNKP